LLIVQQFLAFAIYQKLSPLSFARIGSPVAFWGDCKSIAELIRLQRQAMYGMAHSERCRVFFGQRRWIVNVTHFAFHRALGQAG
jgi:hypothetical protein